MNNKDIYTFISAIDCSVNLTICTETMGGAGLSNSLLESIFSNNLIIAWNTVNFNQILNDESAFLVPQNDIDSLVDVYKFILNNRDDCKKKIKKAESIVQEFDFEHHMLNFSNFVIGNE